MNRGNIQLGMVLIASISAVYKYAILFSFLLFFFSLLSFFLRSTSDNSILSILFLLSHDWIGVSFPF